MATGMDLKLERVKARVKTGDLAVAMGVSASRVSTIEARAVVPDDTAERYLAALGTLTTIPAPTPVAEVA